MARKEGYGRYQGRRSSGATGILKGIIVFLVIVLVLLIAASIFLQDYIIYTDDGVELILPWDETAEKDERPTTSKAPIPLIIADDDKKEGEDGEKETLPPARDLSGPLHAVLISQTSLLAGAAEEQAILAGGNAVVLSMKNDDGTLNYVSENQLAVSAGTSGSDLAVNEAIRKLTESELYTVAEISCFRDDLMSRRRTDLAMLTRKSGYLWLDHYGVRWVSPLQQEVLDYLTDLCVELAEMGFDEILLTNAGYPGHPKDKLHVVEGGSAYPKEGGLEPVIAEFLAQVEAALEPYGVKLSVETMGTELAGETENTGLTMNNVMTYCDRFWLDVEEAEAYSNFTTTEQDLNPAERLVRVADTAGEETCAWAILD